MKIGFLGTGKMGTALALSFQESPKYPDILAYDLVLTEETLRRLNGLHFVKSALELEQRAELLLLCVKPQDMQAALGGLKGDKRYISIAAGLPVAKISGWLGVQRSFVARVMPNIAALVSCSVSAIYCEENTLLQQAESLFSLAGSTLRVSSEEDFHAITALSGSGPALAAAFLQALAQGGAASGLDTGTALSLAQQCLAGTLKLMQARGITPARLIEQVASPGGTTVAALEHLEQHGFSGLVAAAVAAAGRRSRELAETK